MTAGPGRPCACRGAAGAARRRDIRVMSAPLRWTVPAVGSSRRRMQLPTVDLPLPDSPTRPTTSPRSIDSETSSTARRTLPRPASKSLRRPCTSSTEESVTRPPPRGRRGGSRPPRGRAARARRAEAGCGSPRRRARSAARTRSSWPARRATGRARGSRPAARDRRPCAGRRRAGRACTGCCGAANSSSTGASSTVRPAYMTTTRSATSATTPRSWVMSTIAVPRRSRSSRITSSTPAWIVTSSAVVGSSAISTAGSQATAMAIITRWRMPPDSWCG